MTRWNKQEKKTDFSIKQSKKHKIKAENIVIFIQHYCFFFFLNKYLISQINYSHIFGLFDGNV